MWKGVILTFSFTLCVTFCEKLPDYLKPCNLSDPNLNQCILEHGNDAWRGISNGDKRFHLFSLKPMKLQSIDLIAGNIKIHFTDIVAQGLDDCKITNASWDTKKRHLHVEVRNPSAWLTGKYDIEGRILFLPIVGKGNANFTHVGNAFIYDVDYDLEERNGKHYIKITDSKVDCLTELGNYHFDSLFNGNQQMTDEMNNFLNENWREFYIEMKPTFDATILEIVNNILNNFSKKISYEEMFLK